MRSVRLLGCSGLSLAALMAVSTSAAFAQLRSFGEAEGFGGVVTGARVSSTPTVYHVTNLAASGAGSFTDAVSVANRIIVFDVSGTINLTTAISAKSNLTIEGQTAPGAGIAITGAEVSFFSATNDIVRYLRFRPGDSSDSGDDAISGSDGNMILDHDSLEFAKWNNIDAVASSSSTTPQVTIQNSIIADPISNGTSNTGQGFGAHLEAVGGHYTIVNNLWANSHNRNPLAKVNEQFINNVDYNNVDNYTTGDTGTAFKHDVVNNTFIWGPTSTGNSFFQVSGAKPQTFYAVGNVEDSNKDGVLDTGTIITPSSAGNTIVASPSFATTASLPTLGNSDAFSFVINHAGDSISHDQVDSLVIGQVQTLGNAPAGYTAGTAGPVENTDPTDSIHTGMYHTAASDGLTNNGLGTIASVSRAAGFDSDNDGIPDTWETAHGLNPADATDFKKLNPFGYLMIEQYANELGATNDTRTFASTNGTLNAGANWANFTAPGAMDYALIRGNGTANGVASMSSGTFNAMELSIGGNGPAGGEAVNVSGGTVSIYDAITVGDQNNASLNISNGTVTAYNVQVGNTLSGVTYTGTINLSGGKLALGQLVLGGGTPGSWTAGGSMNWTGGTLQAVANLNVNIPIALGATTNTLDSNTFSGTVSGILSDVAGQHGGFTKIGTGTVTLTGANTYTGVTQISGGILAIPALNNSNTPGNLGAASSAASNLVLDGGTLQYAGSATTATDRSFTLTAKGGTLDAGATGQWQFTGTTDVAQSGTGNRTLTFTGSTTNSVFDLGLGDPTSGKTSLTMSGTSTSSRWIIGSSTDPRTYSGDTTITQGTLLTNNSNVLPFGVGKGNLVITAGTVEMNGNDLSINALTGAGALNQRGSTNRTVTLGNGDTSGTFTGTITNTPLSTPGILNLTKTGAGTETLTNASSTAFTYSGTTTINGGLLNVNGTLPNSAVSVQAGALGGNGTALSLIVGASGTVAPGNSIGTFNVTQGANIDGTLKIELNGASTGSADMLAVGGTLDLTGSSLALSTVSGGSAPDDAAYVFATYTTLLGTFGSNITGLPAGYTINYAYNNGTSSNNIAMVVAVPEPSTLLLMLLPATLGLRRRRGR